MIDLYKKLVLSVIGFYLLFLMSPYLWPLAPEQRDAYEWLGYGGSINPYGAIPYLFAAGFVLTLVGMYQLKEWGRRGLLALNLLYGLSLPLWGMQVARPLDTWFGYWVGGGMIVILTLAYTSLNSSFEKDE